MTTWLNAALGFYLLLIALPAFPDCWSPPEGYAPPASESRQVDLEGELAAPWQAGGAIILTCAADGSPVAGRGTQPPRDKAEEMARRVEHFALARRINLAGKGVAHPLGLPLAPPQLALLERFALSDAGAVWLREVADDTLRLFNRGYLEYDRNLWARAVREKRPPKLSELLTGRLTEAGQFAGDARLFLFSGYAGAGAMAHPGAIGLGDGGLRCRFPASDELVDPFAIISHEFGHTRYGDPASAGSLLGEARTVERYENPVRMRDGYEPRAVYFQRTHQGALEAQKGSLLERLLRLERERGIAIQDLTAVDRYHCDCPGPLPIILDCEVRARPAGDDGQPGAPEHDCTLNWRPEASAWPLPGKR
jgi:hypothetical protein